MTPIAGGSDRHEDIAANPHERRAWDIAAVVYSRSGTLLDQGWEPFAVVQREPNTKMTATEATVYFRRRAQ